MRLQNGDVLLAWPLAQHVITAGWTYTSGAAHNAIDLRTQSGTSCVRPVYAAEDGTVDQAQTWDGKTCTGMQSYGNMVPAAPCPITTGKSCKRGTRTC